MMLENSILHEVGYKYFIYFEVCLCLGLVIENICCFCQPSFVEREDDISLYYVAKG